MAKVFALQEKDVIRLRDLLSAYEQGRLTQSKTRHRKQGNPPIESYIGQTDERINGVVYDSTADKYVIEAGTVSLAKWQSDGTTESITDAGSTVEAYNVDDTDLPQDCFVHLTKDPIGGKWFATRSHDLIRFQLTSELPLDGSATARKLEWSGSSYAQVGPEFQVYATLGGIWGPAPIGAAGWCYKTERNVAEIIFMQRNALFVCATLTSTFADGSSGAPEATATLDDYWRGLQPSSSITVVLCDGMYEGHGCFETGTKVVAAYDETTDKYNVIEIPTKLGTGRFTGCVDDQQTPPQADGTLSETRGIRFGEGFDIVQGVACDLWVDVNPKIQVCSRDSTQQETCSEVNKIVFDGCGVSVGSADTTNCETSIDVTFDPKISVCKPSAQSCYDVHKVNFSDCFNLENNSTQTECEHSIDVDLNGGTGQEETINVLTAICDNGGTYRVTSRSLTFNACGLLTSVGQSNTVDMPNC